MKNENQRQYRQITVFNSGIVHLNVNSSFNSMNQHPEVGGNCLFNCFSVFHGFCEEETVTSISSGRKMLQDKIIAGEETLIETLDDQLDESWKRNDVGKIIHEDELDTSREWSEEARSLFEDN